MYIVSRREWNARPPKAPYTSLAGSEGIVAHHLGDGVVRDPSRTDYYALMRQTQNFHMDGRGWNDFAYGFGVGGGKAFMGRGWGVIDGADTDIGRVMHSVLWLGDSFANEIPAEDMAVIWALFDEHNRIYGRKFEGGHRDINATGCPGDNIYAQLKAGRPVNIPTYPTPLFKIEEPAMYTVKNANGVAMTMRVDAGRLLNSWRGPDGVRVPWAEIIPGTVVKNLGEPIASGTMIWVPIIASTQFGDLMLTLVQMNPGEIFKVWNTDQLHDILSSLK